MPEDRSTQALFLSKSINENISSAIVDKLKTKFGIYDKASSSGLADKYVDRFNIRTPSTDLQVSALSGGNQQKTVVAKWMATNPKLFILDTPTVGVDIGAKYEIYEQIQSFSEGGMAVILISDEYEEIRANCNKVLVMREGKVVSILEEEDINSPTFREHLESLVNEGHTETVLIGSKEKEEV